MTTKQQAKTAALPARSVETHSELPTPASKGVDTVSALSPAVQQPTPIKRTVAALDRNILAVEELIEWIERHIESARQLPSHAEETILSLQKQLRNVLGRKAMLERLRAKEIRYTDL